MIFDKKYIVVNSFCFITGTLFGYFTKSYLTNTQKKLLTK